MKTAVAEMGPAVLAAKPGELPAPGSLRVGLVASAPARRQALTALIRDAGHVLAADGAADVLLVDGPALREATIPSVLLAEGSAGTESDVVLPSSPTARQLDAALRGAAAGLIVRAKPADGGFAPAPSGGLRPPWLTPREIEILLAVGEGLSNKQVARRLGISQHTVKFHLEAVFAKLDAGSRAEAVAKGLRQGLIEL